MKTKKRNQRIMVWVSDEEKKLLEAKSKYYNYKSFAAYIRDAAVYEKITYVDLKNQQLIYDAYSQNTNEIKKFIKQIKHFNKYITQIDYEDVKNINKLMFNIIKNQKEMLKLINSKLELEIFQRINKKGMDN